MTGRAAGSRGLVLLGYVVTAACLVWVFHDVSLRDLARGAARIRWPWVAFAVALDLLGYVFQGLRWWMLLPREGRPSVARTTQAVYAGLFTNELLPVRPGELVRAWLVSRWSAAPFTRVLSTVLVERLLDAIWLAAGVALVGWLVPLPRFLAGAEKTLVIVVAVGAALLLVSFVRSRPPADPVPAARGWRAALGALAATSRPADMAAAFAVSALVPLAEGIALWGIMRAWGIALPVGAGVAVLLLVRLGTALPSAPGNLGTYQVLCVVGASLFGVDKTVATGFAFAAFVLLTAPLLVLGFLALRNSGTTLADLRREIATGLTRRAAA